MVLGRSDMVMGGGLVDEAGYRSGRECDVLGQLMERAAEGGEDGGAEKQAAT